MATFFANGPAVNMRTANVGAILTDATRIETFETAWTMLKEDGDILLNVNSFHSSGIIYDENNLPVAGTFESWINDTYVEGGGVEGWVFNGFSAAAHPVTIALQSNDAKMLFGLMLTGDDKLTGTESNDLLDGYGGTDVIRGAGGNDRLFGGVGDDRLAGGTGKDLLSGGLGQDRLTGDAGADKFLFDARPGPVNADRIVDFTPGSDVIQLAAKAFKALSAGTLSPDAFVTGTAAGDADDRIIYDDAAGRLYYDADGSGSASPQQLFAIVTAGLDMGADDFRIV